MELVQKIFLYDALDTLEPKEQSIIKMYYIAGFSEEDIAQSYRISVPRVNQIKKRALQKCKSVLEKKQLSASIV